MPFRVSRYNKIQKPSLKDLASEFLDELYRSANIALWKTHARQWIYIYRLNINGRAVLRAEPSNLKLKLDGSIDLPFIPSETDEQTNVRSNDNQADNSEQDEPIQVRSDTVNENGEVFTSPPVGDDSEDRADSTIRDGSAEKPVSERDDNNLANALRIGVKETKDISQEAQHGSAETPEPDGEYSGIPMEEGSIKDPISADTSLRNSISPSSVTQKSTKFKRHKVQDDERVRKFSAHVYEQALKAFEAMKKKTDPYTKEKIASLADIYKAKFTDFVKRTRETDIKTKEGTQNVILHTIDTSNLIMERIANFLKTDMFGSDTGGLRQGGPSKLQKELDTVKALEFDHACKMFKVCRSANAFSNELRNIISTLLLLPDEKLLQANDVLTEVLKNSDLSAFTSSYSVLNRIKKSINSLENTDAASLRTKLQVLYSVLSKSHLPLVLHKGNKFEKRAVKRTVFFHNLLDAIDDALPPTEVNKREWETIGNRLKRWKDGGVTDVQGTFQALFDNVNRGVEKYGKESEKIRQLVVEIAE